MKIKFKIKRGGVFRQLAAVFLPMAVISLCSCSQEEPVASVQEPTSENIENPITRSPQEAVAIAERAWQEFYGSDASASRSSSAPLLDLSRPVEVVRGIKSRGASDADTLMYVVNFTDDAGFAIVAAPRNKEALLAVTSQGHYYPESMPDEELIPGFEIWLNNARSIIRDSSTIITPIPNPEIIGKLEQKEWEDTLQRLMVEPQVRIKWGQGDTIPTDLYYYPEGYLFQNGRAGCATIALAQICSFFQQPTYINWSGFNQGERFDLDWNEMLKHDPRQKSNSYADMGTCMEADRMATHGMIAQFCRCIANWTDANDSKLDATSTDKDKALSALKKLLPGKSIQGWKDFDPNLFPQENQIWLVRGESSSSGHAWICDGTRYIQAIHYFATRENSSQPWNIIQRNIYTSLYVHYNWGWYGSSNGWYRNAKAVSTLVKSGGNHKPKKYNISEYVTVQ